MTTGNGSSTGVAATRLLVVDDLDAHRYVIAHTLRRAGYEVAEAANGLEALAAVEREMPALVTLDVNMPVMNGFEVTKRLRADPRTARLPVLHISATHTSTSDQTRGLEGGADGYLVHPVDPEVLVATVRSLLRARKAEEERERLLLSVESQKRLLEAVMQHLPVAVTVLEPPDGRAVLMNAAADALWGRHLPPGNGSYAELPVVHADGRAYSLEERPAWRALHRGETTASEEARLLRPDGTQTLVEMSAVPVRDAVGGIRCAVLVVQDVTRERRHEEYQKYVLGIVGHDLRGPLTAVAVSAETLVRAPDLPPRRKAAAERILTSSRRMSRLVSDLLDFSRARLGGGIPVKHESADVASIAGRVVEEIRAANPGRDIQWRAQGDTHGQFDAQRLEQVASNLVSNALAYGEPGDAVIVTCTGDDDHVELEVANGGPPISEAVLARIFEPFQRGERPAATGSFGLGLYIASQIVRGHGGSIDVHSAPGELTRFRVRLPRAAKQVEEAREAPGP